MDGYERRRAGRVHGYARTGPFEGVGDSTAEERSQGSGAVVDVDIVSQVVGVVEGRVSDETSESFP